MDSMSADTQDHYEMWVKAKKKIMGDGSDDGVDLLMLKTGCKCLHKK